jgi:transposase-like protein
VRVCERLPDAGRNVPPRPLPLPRLQEAIHRDRWHHFEDTHLPLALWVRAIHLMSSRKKGISALQLQRNLGIGSYKTAWFMAHRIRLAMKCEPMVGMLGGQVQVDEAYIGGKPRKKTGPEPKPKAPVVVLVETNGKAVSRHVDRVDARTLRDVFDTVVDPSAHICTDEHSVYPIATEGFASHHAVKHSAEEYARKIWLNNRVTTITTNTAECYFSLLKRGIVGVFHQVSKKHLHRYCSEFDFRWNARETSDSERRAQTIKQVEGKRLMYKTPILPKT